MAAASSHLTDLSYEAQELSSLLIHSSSSSSEILNSCRAVESFIQRHNTDQVRHFYVMCFPVLLRKIFGFEENFQAALDVPPGMGGGGWIAQASDYVANALVDLLSPSGALFSSILAADAQNLVRYVFPPERLPAWIRPLLRFDRGLPVLPEACPMLFKGRLKEESGSLHVQLNIFEYFMFWFAYYAVCKDRGDDIKDEFNANELRFGVRRVSRPRSEKWAWASSLSGLSPGQGRGSSGRLNSRPYLHLVSLYLHNFVPLSEFSLSPSPYLHHFDGEDRAVFSRAEFVFHTFVQFWLVDMDSSPLPLPVCQALNVFFPCDNECGRYVPPSADHTEAVRIVVNYVNGTLKSPDLNPKLFTESQAEKSRLAPTSLPRTFSLSSRNVVGFTPWSLLLQRPLYRFILRSFRYWPIGACVKKLHCILDLWLDYLEPWNSALEGGQPMSEGFSFELENKMLRDPARSLSPLSGSLLFKQKGGVRSGGSLSDRRSMDESHGSSSYNEQWQNYVLANYPFYTSLVVHFLVFANKFVHIDTEAVLQMTHKVLDVLASSRELLNLLRRIEYAYNDVISGSASYSSDNLHKFIPAIREQIQEWENDSSNYEEESELILASSHKGGSTLHLFNTSDNGGYHILKLLVLRAEAWIQSSSGEKIVSCLHSLEHLKALTIKIFGSFEIESPNNMVCSYGSECKNVPMMKQLSGFGRHTWADVKYKGDWMRRPIEDSEVAWLARILVRLSDWLNQKLGLDNQASTPLGDNNRNANMCETPTISHPIFAEIREENEVSIVDCLTDCQTWKNILSGILSCFMFYSLSFLQAVQRELRRHGWRVNLRILAEKKLLIFVCTCITLFMFTKMFKRYFYSFLY